MSENAEAPEGAPDNQPTSTAADQAALKTLASNVGSWRWKDPSHESDPANLDQRGLALTTASAKQKECDQQNETTGGQACYQGLLAILDLALDVALHCPKLRFEVIAGDSVLRLCHQFNSFSILAIRDRARAVTSTQNTKIMR